MEEAGELVGRGDRVEEGRVDIPTERLAEWLPRHVEGFGRLEEVAKFHGGQSNPTYRLSDGNRECVLRRKPFGALLPSAHAVEREYRVIAALHPQGFPVPRPYALCEDPEVIGAAFYVMELVEGRILWNGALPGVSPGDRRATYQALVATLAHLHGIDPAQAGLGDFGAPGNYFERQVRRWTKQYRAAETEPIAAMERLIEWLPTRLPEQARVAIIHGDYRIDNMIFAPDRPEVLAVLDWELSTLGDPLADFANLAMNWVMPSGGRKAQLGGLDLTALGIPSLEEIAARYCELTGLERVPDLNWYFAFNLFRLAGIVQGIKKRAIDGNASNAEAAEFAAHVPDLAEQAWQFAQAAGAPA
jgi:aminoglycoside phosphotransferase (APT) family kinase protein